MSWRVDGLCLAPAVLFEASFLCDIIFGRKEHIQFLDVPWTWLLDSFAVRWHTNDVHMPGRLFNFSLCLTRGLTFCWPLPSTDSDHQNDNQRLLSMHHLHVLLASPSRTLEISNAFEYIDSIATFGRTIFFFFVTLDTKSYSTSSSNWSEIDLRPNFTANRLFCRTQEPWTWGCLDWGVCLWTFFFLTSFCVESKKESISGSCSASKGISDSPSAIPTGTPSCDHAETQNNGCSPWGSNHDNDNEDCGYEGIKAIQTMSKIRRDGVDAFAMRSLHCMFKKSTVTRAFWLDW